MIGLAQAHPGPLWLTVLLALLGTAVGVPLSRRLVAAGYRLDDETGPPPRAAWLVPPIVGVLWALLAWRLGGLASGALLPAYLLLAVVGVALVRIDLDVHRLPEGLTLPTVPALLTLLAMTSAVTGDWAALARGVAAGLGGWLVYLAIALISPGGLGLGDATLGGLVSLPLGYLTWGTPVVALLAAFLVAGTVAAAGLGLRRLHLRSSIAFGPYILGGALIAVLCRFQIVGV